MRLNLFILLICTPLTNDIAIDGTKTQPIHPRCMCGHMHVRYNMECACYLGFCNMTPNMLSMT
jgi:hypothetical protein